MHLFCAPFASLNTRVQSLSGQSYASVLLVELLTSAADSTSSNIEKLHPQLIMMLTEQPVNAVKTEPEYKCDSNEAYAKLLWSLLTELTKARDQFRYEGAINDICVLL
jgi:hypothetical protein